MTLWLRLFLFEDEEEAGQEGEIMWLDCIYIGLCGWLALNLKFGQDRTGVNGIGALGRMDRKTRGMHNSDRDRGLDQTRSSHSTQHSGWECRHSSLPLHTGP